MSKNAKHRTCHVSLLRKMLTVTMVLTMLLGVVPGLGVALAEENGGQPDPGNVVLSVFSGTSLARGFTQAELDALGKTSPETYSGYNTYPTYSATADISGYRITDILAAAGISGLSPNAAVTFTSGDSFSATLTYGQLTQTRYYYSNGGERGSLLPAVLREHVAGNDDETLRLYFGQASADEQVRPAYVNHVVSITIGADAGAWGSPTANPASGSVKAGDLIRLNAPSDSGDAKIYYTLDGSRPTLDSLIYNRIAERWLSNHELTENQPIIAPGDEPFTITARIIGLGKNDGAIAVFNYNGATATAPDDGGSSGTTMPLGVGDLLGKLPLFVMALVLLTILTPFR